MTRLIVYAVLAALLLGAIWKFHAWSYESGWNAREALAVADAMDAANEARTAIEDAAAENQANTEAVHEAGDAASVAAAEEIARLRRERDDALRQLQEAYRHDATADDWRHERIPDAVRRVLTASRDQAGGGPG